MENKSLTIFNNKSLARINKQVAITNNLIANSEQAKVVKYLTENKYKSLSLISKYYPLNDLTLDRFSKLLYWKHDEGISTNKAIRWSKELVNQFSDKLDWVYFCSRDINIPMEVVINSSNIKWGWLCANRAFQWSEDFILEHAEKLSFFTMSGNPNIPWSNFLIDYFEQYWNWDRTQKLGTLSCNEGLPWTENLIEKYNSRWNWRELSRNIGLPWSTDFIEKFELDWTWGTFGLSCNSALPWSVSFIERFKEKWEWGEYGLSGNEGLPFSTGFLEVYKDKWDMKSLQFNNGVPWTLLPWDEEKIIMMPNPFKRDENIPESLYSWSERPPWSVDFILKNSAKLDWSIWFGNESVWNKSFKPYLTDDIVNDLLLEIERKGI